MKNLDRRQVLLTGGSALAMPFFPRSAKSADVDVVVIGAGAGGIAAARELKKSGLTVKVIEAANRIGGRVHTDIKQFGVPYDTGAHWLHYGKTNPFLEYGKRNGFDIYPAPEDDVLRVGNREATNKEYEMLWSNYDQAIADMLKAGRMGKDVAPAQVVSDFGDWNHTVHLVVGPYEMAKDFDHMSCKDWYTAEDGTDYYCSEGFGTLFVHRSQDVDVTLNTTAKKIYWGEAGVRVETGNGVISARAVVVTVSLGVLASGNITFEPTLPTKTEEAFSNLTMGHYTHVALQFKENFFGVGADGYLYQKVEETSDGSPKGFAGLIDASETGISYFDLGGDFALQMAQAGDDATLDFVLGELRRMFGSTVDKMLVKSHVAEWSTNPLTLGSYASAEPGGAHSRGDLRNTVADRIWFGGEAQSEDDWATVAGADKAGRSAARRIADVLNR